MKTTLYARVSTTDKGQTCETQLHALREFCSARGWSIAQTYADTGVSGSKESRPQLDQLMKDAKRRKFDAVLVYKLDRFGQSTRHLINSLAEFDSLGVRQLVRQPRHVHAAGKTHVSHYRCDG